MHRVYAGLVILLLPLSSRAQTTAASTVADNAQQFVRAFYAWYVPIARNPKGGVAWERALTKKASLLSDEIGRRLREDDKTDGIGCSGIAMLARVRRQRG